MTWNGFIHTELTQPYMKECLRLVKEDINDGIEVYPKSTDIFNAFKLTKFDKVKVVILGQDPYHGPNQAHGLSFSVKSGKIPPSLQNIYKELVADVGITMPTHGDLTSWAQQGVLLINSTLTVRKGQPNSHSEIGWSTFTNRVISELAKADQKIVFLLWGKFAQSYSSLIGNTTDVVLECAHPSPFSASRGFFGCKHFSKVNEILIDDGKEPIDWQIK